MTSLPFFNANLEVILVPKMGEVRVGLTYCGTEPPYHDILNECIVFIAIALQLMYFPLFEVFFLLNKLNRKILYKVCFDFYKMYGKSVLLNKIAKFRIFFTATSA